MGIALARTLVHRAGSRRWQRARLLYGYPSTGFSRQLTHKPVARRIAFIKWGGGRSCLRSAANALVTTPSPTNTHALTKPQNGKNHPLGRLEPPKRTASRTSTFNVQLCPPLGGWPDRAFFSEHTSQFCLDTREEDNCRSCGIPDHSIHRILVDLPRYTQARQIASG